MRRIIALLLVMSFALSACAPKSAAVSASSPEVTAPPANTATAVELDFDGLSDPNLHRYIEDSVYADIINSFDSDEYFVENVSAVYVSQEYLDELAYNSQANVYFGLTLADLSEVFADEKFVFTLGEDGETTVKPFESYDDTFDKVVRNVAVGTGVILLCVTISAVTAGVGVAPAVSVIFAASAKSATTFAVSGGVFSAVSTGIITGVQTGNFDESMKAAALAGSEGFMWGAITGAITGGYQTAKALPALKGATVNGLTLVEAAKIQRQSKYPLEIIKTFHSMDEYNIYKAAKLSATRIGDRWALIRKIDLNYFDEASGYTNAERIRHNLAPIDTVTGKSYQLHHIGQQIDSPLAILTPDEHLLNPKILNNPNIDVGVQAQLGSKWQTEARKFWKDFLAAAEKGLV